MANPSLAPEGLSRHNWAVRRKDRATVLPWVKPNCWLLEQNHLPEGGDYFPSTLMDAKVTCASPEHQHVMSHPPKSAAFDTFKCINKAKTFIKVVFF